MEAMTEVTEVMEAMVVLLEAQGVALGLDVLHEEGLALWEALYMHGGVAVPLGAPCSAAPDALEALLSRADVHEERRTKYAPVVRLSTPKYP